MTKTERNLLIAALVLALVIAAGVLGRRHFYSSDEARFALLARDILSRGDWLLPQLRDEPYLNKPPLFVWLIAVFSLPGRRVTELSSQLPSALAAVAGVIGTAAIAARLWGGRTGLVAAFILATSAGYVHHAGLVLADMTLTCFTVLALLAFYVGLTSKRRVANAAVYALVGLAVLTKGPAGFVALLPMAAAAFDRQGRSGWRALSPRLGLGVLAIILGPFAFTYLTRDAHHYLATVWGGDYLEWVSHSTEQPASPFFPLGSLFAGTLPWSLLLPVLFWRGGSRWRNDEGGRWVFYWLGLMLLAFLLIAAKRTRYLLPLYPALALLLAQRICELRSVRVPSRLCRLNGAIWIAGCGVALTVLLGWWRPNLSPYVLVFFPESSVGLALTAAVLIAGGVGGGLSLWRGHVWPATLSVALTSAALLVVVGAGYPARYNAAFDISGLAARARAALGPSDELVTYQYGTLSLDFYLERSVPELSDLSDLHRLMAGSGRVLCVLEERRLPRDEARRWIVLDRRVIGGRPVLLVANRSA